MYVKWTQTCRKLVADVERGVARWQTGQKSRTALFALLRFQFFTAPIAAETQTKITSQKSAAHILSKQKQGKIVAQMVGVVRPSGAHKQTFQNGCFPFFVGRR